LSTPQDVVGQSARHTDELSPCAEKGAGAGAVERLDVNGPIPTGANELSQAPRVVLIRLIDLHFKSGTRVLGLKPHNFGPRLRSSCTSHGVIALSIDPYAGATALICSGTDGHRPRHSRRPASSTTQTAVNFCETFKPPKWVIDQSPILRITGHRLPDRDTFGGSRADKDYRMSRHDNAKIRLHKIRLKLGDRRAASIHVCGCLGIP
jgi:hypothetical protein